MYDLLYSPHLAVTFAIIVMKCLVQFITILHLADIFVLFTLTTTCD